MARKRNNETQTTELVKQLPPTPAEEVSELANPIPTHKLALCHPIRMAVYDGLCDKCYAKAPDTTALEHRKTRKALEKAAAQEVMASRLTAYANAHWRATVKAAEEGDARPAEWALTHVKDGEAGPVVDPPQKGPSDTGVKVFVGVKIGGMPDVDGAPSITVQAESGGKDP